jgi:gliding motility-associated-like protein
MDYKMRRLLKTIGTGVFLLCFGYSVQASHIIGGFIKYEHQGEGLYRFRVFMYRDCNPQNNPVPLDAIAHFGVYYKNDSGEYDLAPNGTQSIRITELIPVAPPDFLCLTLPPNICVQEGYYEFDFQVEDWPRNNSVVVSYQRCCRNPTTVNIFTPGEVGVTFTTEITAEAQLLGNNSPDFKAFPPTVICQDFPLEFDHSGTDLEGDSLIYYFCEPLVGAGRIGGPGFPGDANSCEGIRPIPGCPPPFESVPFIEPAYTFMEPMGGDPIVSIDSLTGIIRGTPNLPGQFVVAVCMEEYRDSVLLGVYRRDFQFNVTNCVSQINADMIADLKLDEKLHYYSRCGSLDVSVENISTDKRFINSYLWILENGSSFDTLTTEDLQYTYQEFGQYSGYLIANPGTFCADTSFLLIDLFPPVLADFSVSYDTCVYGPVFIENHSISEGGEIVSYLWDFGDGQTSSLRIPEHRFAEGGDYNISLRVRDENGCEDLLEIPLAYFPIPATLTLDPFDTLACVPATVDFSSLNAEINDLYQVRWDFGDGNTSDETRPFHVYEFPGTYTITVYIENSFGCKAEATFDNYVTVHPRPQAGFTYAPRTITRLDPLVGFTNTSTGAVQYDWTFGEEGTSILKDPTHFFADTGEVRVRLVATNVFGCTDTLIKMLEIIPVITYHMPNAFTPNGDGNNDFFIGAGFLDGYRGFEFRVFNRYGQELFYTENPGEGWNGRINNKGESQPPGVFVYKVNIVGPRGESIDLKGPFMLVR